MTRSLCLILACLLASLCFADETFTDNRVRNLTAFTRLWGYVKHFYPSDEAQDIDWDRFAVYGSQYVLHAQTNDELRKALTELFVPIVPDLLLYSHANPELNLGGLLPNRKLAFWQYEGYNNTHESSVYRSIRTNRPYKIDKTSQNTFIWASLSPQLPQYVDFDTKIRLSFRIWQANCDSLSTEIRMGFGGDSFSEKFNQSAWSEKSYVLEGKAGQKEPLWLAFLNFEHLLVDNFLVEEWHQGTWRSVFFSDFAKDKIGTLPDNFNVNISSAHSTMSSDVDILIENNMGNNCMAIQKASSAESYTLGIVDKIFSEELPYGELLDKQLIPCLNCSFPIVLQCDLEHTYPIADKAKLQKLKQEYSTCDLHDRTDSRIWIAGVIRYWNEMRFFYPYFEYNICDWDKELPLCLERVLQSRNFLEYKQALRLLISQTEDGHAFLSDKSQNSKMPQFNTYPIAGKWIVSSVLDESLGVRCGDEVLKMNGEDFSKLMQDNRPHFISGNPETTDIRLFCQYMRTYQDSVATFTFMSTLRANEYEYTKEMPLTEYTGWKWVVGEDKIVHYSEGIVYLNANIITDEELQEAMPDLVSAKGIILDLRYYPSISLGLLSNLLSEPDSLSNHLTKRYLRPQEELPRLSEDQLTWGLEPAEPHIGAKIVALCGRNSQSYCEAYLANLQHNKLATIVGQPTAGANGNVIVTPLPGEIKVYWTGMLVRNPDKSRFFGVGIIPEVYVDKTIDDIRHGRDPELYQALELLKSILN